MPCEQCNVQFTVFKRKRSCSDCKRYYCHNCLVNTRKHTLLCDRCILFSRRPLLRSDLVKLKTKDLIFYLQSKHISTAGCVEKEDLIDLVIQCVERVDSNQNHSSSSGSSNNTTPQHQTDTNGGSGRRSSDDTNSFDNIKQTCQKFFSNLSDNISDSFANLESRACSKSSRGDRQTRENATEQPRFATREIPTYASWQQESTNANNTPRTTPVQSPSTNSVQQIVQIPVNSPVSEKQSPVEVSNSSGGGDEFPPNEEEGVEECECSDEELINTFNTRTRSPKIVPEANISLSNDDTDHGATCEPSTSASACKPLSLYSKLEIYVVNDDEESSHSSFEELGAIGGISDDSKTATDTTSNTTDQWQMLDLKPDASSIHTPDGNNSSSTATQPDVVISPKPQPSVPPPLRLKKVTRRRSESYLNRRRPQTSIDDDDDEVKVVSVSHPVASSHTRIEEETQTSVATSATRRCCVRCGKNKVNIRQQVEKLRKHLESSQMSESDIKQELSEFLAYLEQRTKSVEYSDSEAGASTPSAVGGLAEATNVQLTGIEYAGTAFSYPADVEASTNMGEKDSRFINLDDFESFKQLENLSVKQLKEVLMLHRVDYKGCCEKQELLDRVGRLWKNLKSTPAVDKLPTDELCKICMDAPIECVILECGHMATCTNCGKVLSECPICRQYIVRVVRFFRA